MNDYQAEAANFRLPTADIAYVQFNMAGEVGEYLGLIAKAIRDGRKIDFEQQAKKELGDILWHVALAASDHGWTLEDVARANIYKLSGRKDKGTIQGSGDNR